MQNDDKEGFIAVVEPVMKWLSENCNPHVEIKITATNAELLQGVLAHNTDEFLKD